MSFLTSTSYPEHIWFIAGLIVAIIALTKLQDLITFSVGLGLVLTGGVETFFTIEHLGYQLLTCLAFSTIIAFMIKGRFSDFKNSKAEFSDVSGTEGEIYDDEMAKGRLGKIKWSGTIVTAKISEDSDMLLMKKGEKVQILKLHDGIFIIDKI